MVGRVSIGPPNDMGITFVTSDAPVLGALAPGTTTKGGASGWAEGPDLSGLRASGVLARLPLLPTAARVSNAWPRWDDPVMRWVARVARCLRRTTSFVHAKRPTTR